MTKVANLPSPITILSTAYRLLLLQLLLIALLSPNARMSVTGTTIVAVKYEDGVVVGADTRTSASGYVSNRMAAKLTVVLDRETDVFITRSTREGSSSSPEDVDASTCCVCRSGSAADTQYLSDLVRTELLARQISRGEMGTVTDAARFLTNMLRNEADLSASLICAGYDHGRGGGIIYSISPGGSAVEEPLFAVQGSGSGYILGHMDANYHQRYADGKPSAEDWAEEDAINFVTKLVGLAMDRDGSSGGFVRMFVINRSGRREITRTMDDPTITTTSKSNTLQEQRKGDAATLKGFAPPIHSAMTSGRQID